VIDENIKNLSGGQLQRIALARVLKRKYDMLILDEVTSSFEPDTD
jgi:ABC-type bacteriocin/lantibiotic exporters, contain an N-terminal double-glycine peptidase domain